MKRKASDIKATYIHENRSPVHNASEGECYICSTATVMGYVHRTDPNNNEDTNIPDHWEFSESLKIDYPPPRDKGGRNSFEVMIEVCEKNNWDYKVVRFDEVKEVLYKTRAVLCRIHTTDENYKIIDKFFKKNPKGVITSQVFKEEEEKRRKKKYLKI